MATGIAPPQSLGNAATKSGIYGLSSDQQLAYYRQLLAQFAPAQYTPVSGGFEQGGEGANSYQQAAQNAANAQVDVARNATFEQTLSPEDRANYEALSKQYESNSNHSMDNMGIFSLLAAGIGGGLAGAYGSAGTAATGATEGAGGLTADQIAYGTLENAAVDGGGGSLGFTGGSGAGLSGASGPTIGSNVGYQLGADAAAGSAPAYGGVGTAGAGAGSDAIIGADGLVSAAPSAGGGAVAAGGGAAAGGGGAAAGGAGSGSLLSGISNAQLLQTGAGLLGAVAGSNKGLNSATTTSQNTVDPRVGQYVYGANGTGGLLGAVNKTMTDQLATGGLNANQQAGLNMQLAALNDPAYGAGLQQMRSAGAGLLGTQPAGNPFTAQGAATQSWRPMATQLNPQQSMPMQGAQVPPKTDMTGLLGNLRPYGN